MGVSDGVAPEFYTHKTLPSYQAMLAWEIVVLVGLFDPLTSEIQLQQGVWWNVLFHPVICECRHNIQRLVVVASCFTQKPEEQPQ